MASGSLTSGKPAGTPRVRPGKAAFRSTSGTSSAPRETPLRPFEPRSKIGSSLNWSPFAASPGTGSGSRRRVAVVFLTAALVVRIPAARVDLALDLVGLHGLETWLRVGLLPGLPGAASVAV